MVKPSALRAKFSQAKTHIEGLRHFLDELPKIQIKDFGTISLKAENLSLKLPKLEQLIEEIFIEASEATKNSGKSQQNNANKGRNGNPNQANTSEMSGSFQQNEFKLNDIKFLQKCLARIERLETQNSKLKRTLRLKDVGMEDRYEASKMSRGNHFFTMEKEIETLKLEKEGLRLKLSRLEGDLKLKQNRSKSGQNTRRGDREKSNYLKRNHLKRFVSFSASPKKKTINKLDLKFLNTMHKQGKEAPTFRRDQAPGLIKGVIPSSRRRRKSSDRPDSGRVNFVDYDSLVNFGVEKGGLSEIMEEDLYGDRANVYNDSFKKDLIERRLFPAFGETNDIFSSRRKSKKDKTFIENGKKSNLEEMRLKANFRKNGAREFRVSGGGGKAEDQLIFRKHLETLRANLRETEVDEGKHTIFGVASSDNIDMKVKKELENLNLRRKEMGNVPSPPPPQREDRGSKESSCDSIKLVTVKRSSPTNKTKYTKMESPRFFQIQQTSQPIAAPSPFGNPSHHQQPTQPESGQSDENKALNIVRELRMKFLKDRSSSRKNSEREAHPDQREPKNQEIGDEAKKNTDQDIPENSPGAEQSQHESPRKPSQARQAARTPPLPSQSRGLVNYIQVDQISPSQNRPKSRIPVEKRKKLLENHLKQTPLQSEKSSRAKMTSRSGLNERDGSSSQGIQRINIYLDHQVGNQKKKTTTLKKVQASGVHHEKTPDGRLRVSNQREDQGRDKVPTHSKRGKNVKDREHESLKGDNRGKEYPHRNLSSEAYSTGSQMQPIDLRIQIHPGQPPKVVQSTQAHQRVTAASKPPNKHQRRSRSQSTAKKNKTKPERSSSAKIKKTNKKVQCSLQKATEELKNEQLNKEKSKLIQKMVTLASIIEDITRGQKVNTKLPFFKYLSKEGNQAVRKGLSNYARIAKNYKEAKVMIQEYEKLIEGNLKTLHDKIDKKRKLGIDDLDKLETKIEKRIFGKIKKKDEQGRRKRSSGSRDSRKSRKMKNLGVQVGRPTLRKGWRRSGSVGAESGRNKYGLLDFDYKVDGKADDDDGFANENKYDRELRSQEKLNQSLNRSLSSFMQDERASRRGSSQKSRRRQRGSRKSLKTKKSDFDSGSKMFMGDLEALNIIFSQACVIENFIKGNIREDAEDDDEEIESPSRAGEESRMDSGAFNHLGEPVEEFEDYEKQRQDLVAQATNLALQASAGGRPPTRGSLGGSRKAQESVYAESHNYTLKKADSSFGDLRVNEDHPDVREDYNVARPSNKTTNSVNVFFD